MVNFDNTTPLSESMFALRNSLNVTASQQAIFRHILWTMSQYENCMRLRPDDYLNLKPAKQKEVDTKIAEACERVYGHGSLRQWGVQQHVADISARLYSGQLELTYRFVPPSKVPRSPRYRNMGSYEQQEYIDALTTACLYIPVPVFEAIMVECKFDINKVIDTPQPIGNSEALRLWVAQKHAEIKEELAVMITEFEDREKHVMRHLMKKHGVKEAVDAG